MQLPSEWHTTRIYVVYRNLLLPFSFLPSSPLSLSPSPSLPFSPLLPFSPSPSPSSLLLLLLFSSPSLPFSFFPSSRLSFSPSPSLSLSLPLPLPFSLPSLPGCVWNTGLWRWVSRRSLGPTRWNSRMMKGRSETTSPASSNSHPSTRYVKNST